MVDSQSQAADGNSSTDDPLEQIFEVFRQCGSSWYSGEAVTQTEHALQAALLAEQSGAESELITAALLHDYGHLIHSFGEDCAEQGIDDHHEERGAHHLAKLFGPAVTEPIRLHVPAKRYLCSVSPEYLEGLSPASVLSLKLQGGPFSAAEAAEFSQHPQAEAAVRLRHWDDEAKVVGLKTPAVKDFRPHLQAALK